MTVHFSPSFYSLFITLYCQVPSQRPQCNFSKFLDLCDNFQKLKRTTVDCTVDLFPLIFSTWTIKLLSSLLPCGLKPIRDHLYNLVLPFLIERTKLNIRSWFLGRYNSITDLTVRRILLKAWNSYVIFTFQTLYFCYKANTKNRTCAVLAPALQNLDKNISNADLALYNAKIIELTWQCIWLVCYMMSKLGC